MFVYNEAERWRSLYAWNAVEVLVDGVMQLGKVVNLAEKGLIVDFGCAGQRSQFVEYHTVFQSQRLLTSGGAHVNPGVQVLLRAGRDCPWAWYSGKALSLGTDSEGYLAGLVVVEVQLPHGIVKELLPMNQGRRPLSESDLALLSVRDGGFVIRECSLPATYSGGFQPPFEIHPIRLPRTRRVLCTAVLGDRLLYLQHGVDRPLQPEELEELYNRMKKNGDIPENLIFSTQITVKGQDRHRQAKASCQLFQFLPSELLREVFQSMDSINRIRCRRVCALWNTVLTTDANLPDVRVSGRKEDSPSSRMPPLFWALNCLLHCVSGRAKWIVLANMEMSECDQADTLIRYSAGRIQTLVFNRCSWIGNAWSSSLGTIMECLRRVCGTAERAVWKQCHIGERRLTAVVPQHSIVCLPDERLLEQLRDMFEKHLVVKEPVDRALVPE
ncbi:uncharacterized protein LOC129599070 [Paramacrobiotus metropolitanus]|uniref:uncharacterized protein LOC129599070 n=1 Tax=Paramacrobiotus metropolitanus TaxID=2943436 RepID=UPI002445F002|nr:uncharacterized protein LOC129599070 [Paramacrobiotus metropolitanus]